VCHLSPLHYMSHHPPWLPAITLICSTLQKPAPHTCTCNHCLVSTSLNITYASSLPEKRNISSIYNILACRVHVVQPRCVPLLHHLCGCFLPAMYLPSTCLNEDCLLLLPTSTSPDRMLPLVT